jgi:hypothetical protein
MVTDELDEKYIFEFLDKLKPEELENLKYHLQVGWQPALPTEAGVKDGYACLNVLYQTRELTTANWADKCWEFRARVCELVGVEFSMFRRPKSRKYTHQLAVINRLTRKGRIKEVLTRYFEQRSVKTS